MSGSSGSRSRNLGSPGHLPIAFGGEVTATHGRSTAMAVGPVAGLFLEKRNTMPEAPGVDLGMHNHNDRA